jgi:hypothetical protein
VGDFLSNTDHLPPYKRRISPLSRRLRTLGVISFCLFLGLCYGFLFAILPPFFYVPLAIPIALLALAVAWALPDRPGQDARWVRRALALFLVAFTFWPNYLAVSLPGTPWVSLNRAAGILMGVSLIIYLATSQEGRERLADGTRALGFLKWLALTYLLLQFLTVPFSATATGSVFRALNFQLEFTLPFIASLIVFAREGSERLLIRFIVAGIIFQVVLAAGEAYTQGIFWAKYVPDFLKADPALVNLILAGTQRAYVDIHRSQGSFSNPLPMAEYLALSCPFLVWGIVYARTFRARIGFGLLLAAGVCGVYFSQSRLGFIGGMAALGTFLILLAVTIRKGGAKGSFLPPIALLALPSAAISIIALSFASGRIRTVVWGAGHTVGSDDSRFFQYERGFQELAKWPFGYGMGQAATRIGQIGPNGYNIDTYYMAIALDTGVIGFFCFYGFMIGLAAVAASRSLGSAEFPGKSLLLACTASIVTFLVTKSVLSLEDTHPFFAIVLGLTTALVARSALASPSADTQRSLFTPEPVARPALG